MPNTASHCLIVPVWGDQYTRICTDILLPSLLAPGNLDRPHPGTRPVIAFACPPPTRAAIRASPAFAALSGRLRMDFVDNADLISGAPTKYQAMSESIRRVMTGPAVRPGHTVLVFLNPDVLCAAGLIAGITDAMAAGRRAVMVTGLRTRLDRIPDAVAGFRDGPALNVPAPELGRLAVANLHPLDQAYVWNRGAFPVHWPSRVFFDAADGGLFMQCFHLHPIAMICPDPVPDAIDTIDGAFLQACGLAPGDVHVATDSGTTVVVEVSGAPYEAGQPTAAPSARRMADFAVRRVSDIHWHLFGHRIAFAGPNVAAPPEMDRLVARVLAHRVRLPLARRWPRLDRRLAAPAVDLAARLGLL